MADGRVILGFRWLANTTGQFIGYRNPVNDQDETPWDVVYVPTSRALTFGDNTKILELAADVAITIPAGLPSKFAVLIIPAGTNTIVSSGGTLLNGATTTVSRPAALANNTMFAIQGRVSAANSYVISGAAS